MKLTTYIIVSVLLFSFSIAANKSITELGEVQIEDLFYNSDSPLIPAEIEKIELYQVDKILIKNEDLELESLEIADIDIATFGEYEAFLNKYYDDNYSTINSKIIRQLEFISGGIIGQKIPFGTNAKTSIENGITLGLNLNNISNIKYKHFDLSTNLEISYDSNRYKNLHIVSDFRAINIEPSLNLKLRKNINLKSGLGLMSIKRVESSTGKTINKGYGLSSFLELQYKIKVYDDIHFTIFSRAKLEKSTSDLILYNKDSTVESLVFGIGTMLPIYLTY